MPNGMIICVWPLTELEVSTEDAEETVRVGESPSGKIRTYARRIGITMANMTTKATTNLVFGVIL